MGTLPVSLLRWIWKQQVANEICITEIKKKKNVFFFFSSMHSLI